MDVLTQCSHPKTLRNDLRVIGLVRRRWRCGWIEIASVKLKIECVSAKIAQEGKMAYLGHAHTVQPPRYPSKRRWEVHGPWRQRGRIKIEPVKVKIEHLNISQAPEVKMTYQIRVSMVQPRGTPSKCFHRVIGPWCQHGRIKSRPRNVKRTERSGRTYLERSNVI